MAINQTQEAIWSQRYRDAGDDYLFGTTPAVFLARREALFSPQTNAFLVADGEGRNSVCLAERGLEITAIDLAAIAVQKARSLAASRGVHISVSVDGISVPDWPPVKMCGRFDWVLGGFIQFVGGAERIKEFAAIKHMTRPSGRLLLHGYTPKQLDYKTGGQRFSKTFIQRKCSLKNSPAGRSKNWSNTKKILLRRCSMSSQDQGQKCKHDELRTRM
ncbi:MAG: hypothetical protein NVSMB6_26950 [Burkholderiaceae bacterium]